MGGEIYYITIKQLQMKSTIDEQHILHNDLW